MQIYLWAALIAYLLGSFNPSVLVSKYIFKRDTRSYGSKNPGTSNTVYVLGVKAGVLVFLFDAAKGFFALYLAERLFGPTIGDVPLLLAITSLAAVLGHCQSIFLKFKGGKGLATLFGVYLYQFPILALTLLGVFAVTVLISKYIAIGTFTVITLVPVSQVYFYGKTHSLWAILIMFIISGYLWYRHRENIARLIAGTEVSIRTPRISEEELQS